MSKSNFKIGDRVSVMGTVVNVETGFGNPGYDLITVNIDGSNPSIKVYGYRLTMVESALGVGDKVKDKFGSFGSIEGKIVYIEGKDAIVSYYNYHNELRSEVFMLRELIRV